MMPHLWELEDDQLGGSVEDGRLADAGLADDRQATSLAVDDVGGERDDGGNGVTATGQRRWAEVGGRHRCVGARDLPDAGTVPVCAE